MEYDLLGMPSEGPTLELDHEEFAYAGKFVMSRTGKAVIRDNGATIGATAFDADHADQSIGHIRYITVKRSRQGEGIGPRLLRFTAEIMSEYFESTEIAVNNPIAYQACYRAGFRYTGQQTGLAELTLEYAPGRVVDEPYRQGMCVFESRDLPANQQAVVDRHITDSPPSVIDLPAV